MPLPREPFSVPDLLAGAWDEMVRRSRRLQAANDPFSDHGASVVPQQDGYAALVNRPDLSLADWRNARSAQLRGVAWDGALAPRTNVLFKSAAAADPRPTPGAAPVQPPLTGRPGVAAQIAGALNAIAAAPNTSAHVDAGLVHGTVTRGAGREIAAQGRYGLGRAKVRGVLDPPTGRAEISASGLKGGLLGLPPRVRIYNTPTGELDVDLTGPIRIGPKIVVSKGTYPIGAADAPPRR